MRQDLVLFGLSTEDSHMPKHRTSYFVLRASRVGFVWHLQYSTRLNIYRKEKHGPGINEAWYHKSYEIAVLRS